MSFLTITLIAVATILVVIVIWFVELRVSEVWQSVPREIYARDPLRVLKVRPLYICIAYVILNFVRTGCMLLHWSVAYSVAAGASTIILMLFLVSCTVWAIRIVRQGASVDGRLRRFAKYALWGSAVGIMFFGSGIVVDLCRG
jgi:hypothetical protein